MTHTEPVLALDTGVPLPAAAAAADPLAGLHGLAFAKGHGTGNDFVLISDPDGFHEVSEAAAARLCDRHRGIGGDGVIRAVRSDRLPAGRELLLTVPEAAWFMDYRNADGSLSEMCGNGVRVFVEFLRDQGLVALEPGRSLVIGTRAGAKTVTRTATGYAVDMGPWEFIYPALAADKAMDSTVQVAGLDVARPALSVSLGNPHTVVALAHADELAGTELHHSPLVEPQPPAGTNVEFVVPAEPLVEDGIGQISMRVHERGVGETQSCGTGACAAAAAIRFWAGNEAPGGWAVGVPGGVLGVAFIPGSEGREHIELSGPAQLVAHGSLE